MTSGTAPRASVTAAVHHVFVYGTLRAGDVRWQFLEPFVVDEGWADTVGGRLFDTGLDYPAAVFASRVDSSVRIVGQTHALLTGSLARCLDALDRVEDTVGGRYRRVVVTTGRGIHAYAYEYGSDLDLTPIESGDWFAHREVAPSSPRPAEVSRSTLTP